MLSMHRAANLAAYLRANPTRIAEVARMAWSDGGKCMLQAVSEQAGISIDQLLTESGLHKNWERTMGRGHNHRKHNALHQPGARRELREIAAHADHEW